MRNEKGLESEFKEFVEADAAAPPRSATHAIFTMVRGHLLPNPTVVFSKVALAVAVSGTASLLVCPQFGVGRGHHSEAHHLFMALGPLGCSVACGAFFAVLGLLAAVLFLRPEELRLVRRNRFLLVATVSALALSGLVCFGAEVLVETAVLWFLGSAVGGLVSIETAAWVMLGRDRLVSGEGEA